MAQFGSFVAVGDSFSEGVGDPREDGGWRGWADRYAALLAGHQGGLRYANLAIRGKLLGQVIAGQLPEAIAMAPDLVSIAAGGNDLLRPRSDPDALAEQFDAAVAQLAGTGAAVLVFTGFDTGGFPLLRLIRGKIAAYNMHLRVIAARHGCYLADLWSMRVLADPREWADDRLHLSADGHRRVALLACEVTGVPVSEDWRAPLPELAAASPGRRAAWLAARRHDARWARQYAAPWLGRRLRGISTGDSTLAKLPELRDVGAC
ncbi:MAG TPA: SGNH/GDSL hydrolase family protein [Streptosporangiaceae bacterium]|jgi:lysophospholipase L1-like esterase